MTMNVENLIEVLEKMGDYDEDLASDHFFIVPIKKPKYGIVGKSEKAGKALAVLIPVIQDDEDIEDFFKNAQDMCKECEYKGNTKQKLEQFLCDEGAERGEMAEVNETIEINLSDGDIELNAKDVKLLCLDDVIGKLKKIQPKEKVSDDEEEEDEEEEEISDREDEDDLEEEEED